MAPGTRLSCSSPKPEQGPQPLRGPAAAGKVERRRRRCSPGCWQVSYQVGQLAPGQQRASKASHAIKAAPTHCLRPDAIPGDV